MQPTVRTIEDFASSVSTKEDFDQFIQLLIENYRREIGEWENRDLENFLSGLGGFIRDLDGYIRNVRSEEDLDHPSWSLFADMLLAARVYE